MIPLNERRKIVGASFLLFFHGSVPWHHHAEGFNHSQKCYSHILEHFIDVTIMIDCSILENH